MRKIVLILIMLLPCMGLSAQRFSLETNFVEWANLGTMNLEAGISVSRHFSIHADTRINPWTFRPGNPEDRIEDPIGDSEKQFQNRKQAYAIGLRYWPWYVYSGWWFSLKGQYMEYDYGGFITHPREAGDAVGASLGAGYTYMLTPHWNIEFGASVWGGYKKYGSFRCTNCGQPTGSGQKLFILPDDVKVSLMYVF